MGAKKFEQANSQVLSDLEQVRILADPLRVRILELLARDELTTKQVAERLGEKPTKLYHHVETLQRVGLLHLTRTRQNRGTLEKYYRAVARSFTVDAGLFRPGVAAAADSPLPEMVASVLGRTREELTSLMDSDAAGDIVSAGLISFCEIHAPAEEIEQLRRDLEALIQGMAAPEGDSAAEGSERRYRLTLAFFPLDRG